MFTALIVKPLFNLLVLIYAILPGHNFGLALIIFALILRGVGVLSSILGILAVRVPAGTEMRDPMRPINTGYYTSSIASVIGFFIVNYFYMTDAKGNTVLWKCESADPAMLVRQGWTHDELKPGDEVTLIGHPAKSGVKIMVLDKMILANGKEVPAKAVVN